MQHCILLFFISITCDVMGMYDVGPIKRKINSIVVQPEADLKRSRDHIVQTLELYQLYHSDDHYKYYVQDHYQNVTEKIEIANWLLQELRVVEPNSQLDCLGYEDAVSSLQATCNMFRSCLPRWCVDLPANMYIIYVLRSIKNHVSECEDSIYWQERS